MLLKVYFYCELGIALKQNYFELLKLSKNNNYHLLILLKLCK